MSSDLKAEIARLTAEVERLTSMVGPLHVREQVEDLSSKLRVANARELAAEATVDRYAEALREHVAKCERCYGRGWYLGACRFCTGDSTFDHACDEPRKDCPACTPALAALASHPAPVAPETREEAEVRSRQQLLSIVRNIPPAMREAAENGRAQGRREGMEEAVRTIDEVLEKSRKHWGADATNTIGFVRSAVRALLDAPPTVADPLDAVAEIAAWRGLSEEQRRAHLDKLDALIDFAEAGSDEPVRVVDRTVTALLRRLSPPPVASKEQLVCAACNYAFDDKSLCKCGRKEQK